MELLKPFPGISVFYVENSPGAYAKFIGYLSCASMVRSNFYDFFYGKLRKAVSFSAVVCSVLNSIRHVFCSRSPSEIGQKVIFWVSITMKRFTSFWTGTNKCLKNKDMNTNTSLSFTEANYQMPAVSSPWFQNPFADWSDYSVFPRYISPQRFNAAMGTYFIKAFKSYNRFPLFNHSQSPITKAPWEEVRHQHGKLVFGSYPSRTGTLYG